MGRYQGRESEQKARPRVDLCRKLVFPPPSDPVPPRAVRSQAVIPQEWEGVIRNDHQAQEFKIRATFSKSQLESNTRWGWSQRKFTRFEWPPLTEHFPRTWLWTERFLDLTPPPPTHHDGYIVLIVQLRGRRFREGKWPKVTQKVTGSGFNTALPCLHSVT